MYRGSLYGRGRLMISKATDALRARDWSLNQIDPDGLRYLATITVWGHWILCAVGLIELVYRPYYGVAKYAAYSLLLLVLVVSNGYIHYRLRSNRAITWRWLQALYTIGVAVISVLVAISGGFSHPFLHEFYYPALAAFAVLLTSFRLTMAWVTMVAVAYILISLIAGDGLDLEARNEKALLARVAAMYVVVATVNVASRFERIRRGQAVQREQALERERMELSQALQHERIELSQTIHDTAAQSAYMIGLGIDTAKAIAADADPELTATLAETSRLSRSMIWNLRHPINMGGIYEGKTLGRALTSHASSFTTVTTVPAEITQTGVEPSLCVETKSRLFSIAHNALTNAYLHSEASRTSVHLEFGEEDTRLSVSDNGIGLPDDYSERGRGFTNMTSTAERLGGRLVVEKRGAMGGATVTCVIPLERG